MVPLSRSRIESRNGRSTLMLTARLGDLTNLVAISSGWGAPGTLPTRHVSGLPKFGLVQTVIP